jgi:hypothetical protein
MYFLLSLFFIRTTSKITYRVMHTSPVHQIATVVAYIILFHTLPLQSWFFPGLDPIYHALWGMQFYLIGVAAVPWISLLKASASWLSAVAIAAGLFFASFFDGMAASSQFFLLFGSYLFFLSRPDHFQLLSSLGQKSMGIYLIHIPLVMKIFSVILGRLLSPSTPLFFIFLTTATLSASAFFTSLLLQHPYGRTVFGESPRPSPRPAPAP